MPPRKAARLTTIPFENEDYLTVNFREAQSRTFGSQSALIPSVVRPTAAVTSSVKWQAAKAWEPEDNTQFALDADESQFIEAVNADMLPKKPPKKKSKPLHERSKVSRRPHVVWKELYRSTYLDELIRQYGRGDFRSNKSCPDCLARGSQSKPGDIEPGDAIYRCTSGCFLNDLVCQACCLRRHKRLPLHRIEKWTGTHSEPVSLKSLGLRVQLNHTSLVCSNPEPCHMAMSVLHTNGIHDIAFDFCGCEKAEPRHIQLLRRGFYPASQRVIKTCASFELLELLHKFSLTTKASIYDFYRGLEKLTDSSGIRTPKSKYRALLRMLLQYRHLKLLLWAGRAHDPSGPSGTKPGGLALTCLSCPIPGVNLPHNWEEASAEDKFIYTLFVCMDANFRLKNQMVSNYSQDPGLGIGMAYMVPRKEYEAYVLRNAKDSDISSCVGFQAIAQANTRFSKGLRYTGVGGIFCGRSEMVLPNGIGNLQKGERYCNMDYIFASGIRDFRALLVILISYDIACQWFVNLKARLNGETWPTSLPVPICKRLIPAIPKLHEPMHDAVNHQQYSLNLIPGVGLSDLECPERVWAGHNAVGNSTKGQGPGSRHDVLDDHFNWWNWLKIIGLGATLLRKYRAAIADRNLQVEAHKGLTATLSRDLVKKWTKEFETWDEAEWPKTVKNPYAYEETEVLSEAEVRKQLAKEEESRLAKGGVARHLTSPSSFITMALDIENTARIIRRLAKDKVAQATARQESGLIEQRNHLRSRIKMWEVLLPIYMPGLLQHQSDLDKTVGPTKEPEHPENIPLWLPSRIPADKRRQVCDEGLPEMEERLRTAQCYDALESLRHTLRLKARLLKFKNQNVRGQREGTRSRAIIDRVHNKGGAVTAKYRQARAAKLALTGPGEWEDTLRVLNNEDVRTYQQGKPIKPTGRKGTLEDEAALTERIVEKAPSMEAEWEQEDWLSEDEEASVMGEGLATAAEKGKRKKGTGETKKLMSWIWVMSRQSVTDAEKLDDEHDDILKIEWGKSWARSKRATEEVRLLKEEMRRTLETLSWKKKQWLGQVGRRKTNSALDEGLRAVAYKHSVLQDALSTKFADLWKAPLGDQFIPSNDMPPTSVYEDEVPDESENPDIVDEEEVEAEEVVREENEEDAEVEEEEGLDSDYEEVGDDNDRDI